MESEDIQVVLERLRQENATANAQANYLASELREKQQWYRRLRGLVTEATNITAQVIVDWREKLRQLNPLFSSTTIRGAWPHSNFFNSGTSNCNRSSDTN